MNARVTTALVVLAMGALPASASAEPIHVVGKGETLTSIAATDGLSVSALAAANGLSTDAELIRGQIIHIPPRTAQTEGTSSSGSTTSTTTASTNDATTVATNGRAYVVRWGDTLTAIAARYGTTVSELASLNGLRVNGILREGSLLHLPSSTSATSGTEYVSDSSSRATNGGSTSTTSTSSASQSAGPYPTQQRVDSSEIAAIAEADGVPVALAQAIGWQESGWNNAAVSRIGAVGVMQIVPSTWTWIDDYLTPNDKLAPASATENVRAGVLLLHDLLSLTGNNYAETAAGYYQGLSSVEAHGMYASTKRYVADVLALVQRFGG
jgi:LysM repeat protein